MPKIEIVSIRFNLDKEHDNTLFALLQKRAPARKRNEFIKQLVSSALQENAAGGKGTARRAKEPPRELADRPASKVSPGAQGHKHTSEPDSHAITKPSGETQLEGKSSGLTSETEPEKEAANLVGSLVQ